MPTWRLHFIFLLFLVWAAAISGRLFSLQVVKASLFSAFARGQQQVYQEIAPERGRIFFSEKDGKKVPAVLNRDWPMAYIVPKDVPNLNETLEKLAKLLNLDQDLVKKVSAKPNDPYEPLKTRLSQEEVQKLNQNQIKGVGLRQERLRHYPFGSLAAHVLGFMGYVGEEYQGVYGIEKQFNQRLQGKPGVRQTEKDARGTLLDFFGDFLRKPRPGEDVILTIEPNVQYKLEEILQELMDKWQAEQGTIIVMDPTDGAILALANNPTFDPNHIQEVKDLKTFLNPAVSLLFEPGSVFKPITMAAAIDSGAITPQTTYENTGSVKIGSYTISNVLRGSAYEGQITMTRALEASLNTGAVFAEQKLGHEQFRNAVERFGFSQVTGVELPAEISGDIKNLNQVSDIHFATASFGQGIAVTPLSLARAISAIANRGTLMKPYIVKAIIQEDGSLSETKPKVIRQVISPQTALQVTSMMISVVKNGTAKKVNIPGYSIAAKTGTAQVPAEDRKGYTDKTIHSYVAFAPAFDPKFLVLAKLDNPKGVRFADGSLGPAMRNILEYLLQYYAIPPDEPIQ